MNWRREWLKNMFTQPQPEMGGTGRRLCRASSRAGWQPLIASIWSGGLALVNLVSLLLVTPVVAFYLLNDWDHMVARVDSWLPRAHAETIRKLAREIDEAMAGFIRGQGTVCLLLGAFYAISLSLAGLSFGMLIGLVTGMLSFIPFVGAIIGGVAAIGMAVVQFWPDWVQIAIIAGIFVLGQFIEGNFLSPKLVGDSVGLHPVWLMFALFAFGYLFGFVGLLMAVPLGGGCRRADPLCAGAISDEPALSSAAQIKPLKLHRHAKAAGRQTQMSAPPPRQLILDIALPPAYGTEDFLVAPSNQLAFDFIDRWPRLAIADGSADWSVRRRQIASSGNMAPPVRRFEA